jgi:hypothetical protein
LRRLAFLLLLASPAVPAQATGGNDASAWETLHRCVATTKPQAQAIEPEMPAPGANGLETLEQSCPGLQDALRQIGYYELLATDSAQSLTGEKLARLEKIALRYRDARSVGLAVEPLNDVLEEIGVESAQPPPSAWQRFSSWLRDLAGRKEESDKRSWLDPWFDKMEVSDRVRTIMFWSMVVLVIGIALWVVGNEIRASGVMRGRRRGALQRVKPAVTKEAKPESVDDVDGVPLQDRPSFLLRALIVTLTRSGRLTHARAMTHGELTSRAVFDGADQRESFQRVVGLAERVLYGGASPAQEDIERIVREGRDLDASLKGAAR